MVSSTEGKHFPEQEQIITALKTRSFIKRDDDSQEFFNEIAEKAMLNLEASFLRSSPLLIEQLAKKDFQAILARFPSTIPIETISKDGLFVLKAGVVSNHFSELLLHLPKKIDLLTLDSYGKNFFSFLIKEGHLNEITTFLPDQFTIFECSESAIRLLLELIQLNQADGVIEKLEPPAQYQKLVDLIDWNRDYTYPVSEIQRLLSKHKSDSTNAFLCSLLPVTIDFTRLSIIGSTILDNLLENEHFEEVIQHIPESISIESISSEAVTILSRLMRYNPRLIAEKLPKKVNLNKANYSAIEFFIQLVRDGYFEYIKDSLPDLIDIEAMTFGESHFFNSLMWKKRADEFIKRLPKIIDLSLLSDAANEAFSSLLEYGYKELLLAHVQFDFSLKKPINRNTIYLLSRLFTGLDPYATEVITQLTPQLRKPLTVETPPSEDVGPTIEEQLAALPIDWSIAENLPGNWQAVDLKKGNDSKAKLKVYLRKKPFEMIFWNTNIVAESVTAYQYLTEIIPGYISAANYPELHDDQALHIFGNDKYRETYCGPNLASMALELLPATIQQSINQQVAFVAIMLGSHGINHGHQHLENFNVRFLVQYGQEKSVYFDPNQALQAATNDGATITPIVILRDWDQARGVKEPFKTELERTLAERKSKRLDAIVEA